MRLYECPLGHKWGKAGYGQDLTDNILRKVSSNDCPTCRINLESGNEGKINNG